MPKDSNTWEREELAVSNVKSSMAFAPYTKSAPFPESSERPACSSETPEDSEEAPSYRELIPSPNSVIPAEYSINPPLRSPMVCFISFIPSSSWVIPSSSL